MGRAAFLWAIALFGAGCTYDLALTPAKRPAPGCTECELDGGFADAAIADRSTPDVARPDAGFADAITAPDLGFFDAVTFDADPPDFGGVDLGMAPVLPDCPFTADAGLAPRWASVPVQNGPMAAGHTMELDDSGRLLVYGGRFNTSSTVWASAWNGPLNFSALLSSGGPGFLAFHSSSFSSGLDQIIVFGGFSPAGVHGDTWIADLPAPAEWLPVSSTPQPGPRVSPVSVINEARGELWLHGGELRPQTFGDLWRLGPLLPGVVPSWTQVTPNGAAPAPRGGHSAIFASIAGRAKMIIFGGRHFPNSNLETFTDVWSLDLATQTWAQIDAGSMTRARAFHRVVYHPPTSSMIVVGGVDELDQFSWTVWRLDLAAQCWQELEPSGVGPGGIAGHGMVIRGDRILIYGGDPTQGQSAFELLLR